MSIAESLTSGFVETRTSWRYRSRSMSIKGVYMRGLGMSILKKKACARKFWRRSDVSPQGRKRIERHIDALIYSLLETHTPVPTTPGSQREVHCSHPKRFRK